MRQKIILVCEYCLSRNYNTFISVANKDTRIALKKFCKQCSKHTLHKETR